MADDSNFKSAELLNIIEDKMVKTVENCKIVLYLSVLESSVIVCVLQKSSDMLNILKPLLPCPNKQWDENYKSLPERFMYKKKVIEIIKDKSEGDLSMSIKVQRCRRCIEAIFKDTISDLLNNNLYFPIINHITCVNLIKNDNETIVKENNYFKDKLKYFNEQIKYIRDETQKQLALLTEDKMEELKQSALSRRIEKKVLESYVNRREAAHTFQSLSEIREVESELEEILDDYDVNFNMENRVHQEIMLYLQMNITELQEQFNRWNDECNFETNKRDVELLQLQNKRDEQNELMERTLEIFTERSEIIEKLQAESDERDRLAEENLLMIKSAARIQDWWRRYITYCVGNNRFATLSAKRKKKKGRDKK